MSSLSSRATPAFSPFFERASYTPSRGNRISTVPAGYTTNAPPNGGTKWIPGENVFAPEPAMRTP